METKRATIYFVQDLHRALKLKAATTDRSISELVNEAVRYTLAEDSEDIAAVQIRESEPLISFEDALKDLKNSGKIENILTQVSHQGIQKTTPSNPIIGIIKRIESLSTDPRPPESEKLTGKELYRIRQGDYRIAYSIQNDDLTIWIIKIGHREDIYRRL